MAPAPKTVAELEGSISDNMHSDDIRPLVERYVKAQRALITLQEKHFGMLYENASPLSPPEVGHDPYAPAMPAVELGIYGAMRALAKKKAEAPFFNLPKETQQQINDAREELDTAKEFIIAVTRTQARIIAREAVQTQKDYAELLSDLQRTEQGRDALKEAEYLLKPNAQKGKNDAPADSKPSPEAVRLVLEAQLIGRAYGEINTEADAPLAKRRTLISKAVATLQNALQNDEDYINAQKALKKEWASGKHTFVEHLNQDGSDNVPFLKATEDALAKALQKAEAIIKEKKLLEGDEKESIERDTKEVLKQIRRDLVMPANAQIGAMREPADERLQQLAMLATTPAYQPATPEGYQSSAGTGSMLRTNQKLLR